MAGKNNVMCRPPSHFGAKAACFCLVTVGLLATTFVKATDGHGPVELNVPLLDENGYVVVPSASEKNDDNDYGVWGEAKNVVDDVAFDPMLEHEASVGGTAMELPHAQEQRKLHPKPKPKKNAGNGKNNNKHKVFDAVFSLCF
jgi:hypothetical protein